MLESRLIRLSLLGPTSCRGHSDKEFPGVVRSRKRLGLLAYLAIARPRGFHRRDTLVGLLWAESDQKHARGSLRQAVRHLRGELDDVVSGRGTEEIGLDWSRFSCDATECRQAFETGGREEGLRLYADHLLPGFHLTGAAGFEDWLDQERRELRRLAADAAWQLGDQASDSTVAISWARKAAALTPYDEAALRRFMAFLAERGDRVGALREYERFAGRIESEFETEPDEQSRALASTLVDLPEHRRTSRPSPNTSHGLPAPQTPAAAIVEERGPRGVSQKRTLIAAVILTGAVSLALVGTEFLRTDRAAEPVPPSFRFESSTRLTSDEGLEYNPALSPEGDRIAYVAGVAPEREIRVRRLAGGRHVDLTRELEGSHRWPAWSPDGETVAFVTQFENGESHLRLAAATGGDVRPLLDGTPEQPLTGPSWSPDGARLAFGHGRTLQTLDLESGETSIVARGWAPHSLAWSPSGDRIAFVSENAGSGSGNNRAPSSIYIITVDAAAQPVLVAGPAGTNHSPVWWHDGPTLLFISDRDGQPDIYGVDVTAGGAPSRLSHGLAPSTIDVSGDGSRLVYSVLSADSEILRLSLGEAGAPASASQATALTSGRQAIETLRVSPDGRWLCYDSDRDGISNLYKLATDGGAPIRLSRATEHEFGPTWSPNGEQIAFYSFWEGRRDLFVMDADGRNRRRITEDDGSDAFPDWGTNGELVYQHNPTSSDGDLPVLMRLSPEEENDSTRRQITIGWSELPRWSPDAKYIAYKDGEGFRVLDVGRGDEIRVGWSAAWWGLPVWTPGSEALLLTRVHEGRFGLWRVPIQDGIPEHLVDFGPGTPERFWYDSDGSTLFFSRLHTQADIWLAEIEPVR